MAVSEIGVCELLKAQSFNFAALKDEELAHKDIWSKFLSGEETTLGDVFVSELEEKLLAMGTDDNLPERLQHKAFAQSDFAISAIDRFVSTFPFRISTHFETA